MGHRTRPLRWVKRLAVGMTRGERATYFVIQLLLVAAGTALALTHKPALVAVGTSIIATGAVGLLTFARLVFQEDQAQRLRVFTEFGIDGAFRVRGAMIRNEYDRRLADAHRGIDILGFGLKHLEEDYRDQFERWAAACPVRILLIDPEAPGSGLSYAQQRDVEEGDNPGKIANEVDDFLQRTADLRRRAPERFQVRLYRALPSINLFRVDDTMFFGPYLLNLQSRNTPTFLLGRGVIYDQLADHFEALWSDRFSRPAP